MTKSIIFQILSSKFFHNSFPLNRISSIKTHVYVQGYQRSYPRPTFITGGHFNGKNVDVLYSRNVQRETIAGLIGSFGKAQFFVEPTSDIFMARGHLAAKVDFIYGAHVRD